MIRRMILTGLIGMSLTPVVLAQQGTPSEIDGNRTPAYGPNAGGPGGFNAAQPYYQQPIPSFQGPTTPIQQGPPPTRSPISPYLNLFGRGGGGVGGFNAIDYYNFVRPGTQVYGNNYGPPNQGGYQPYNRFAGAATDPDVRLDPDSVLRPAGSIPSAFQTSGRYFNSMGTIGIGARVGQQQQQQQRRR